LVTLIMSGYSPSNVQNSYTTRIQASPFEAQSSKFVINRKVMEHGSWIMDHGS
jgi:hypothetical protein